MWDKNVIGGVSLDNRQYATEGNAVRQSTDRFPCPACGGIMDFDPESQCLKCPYCDNKIEITKNQDGIVEYDFETAEDDAPTNWGNEKRVIHCQSCGAETVLDENSTAQFCAFCGSSHIVKTEENPGIVPESLIPFKITKESAIKRFKEWINNRFFAPGALKSQYQEQKMTGVYIPCWTYDSDTDSFYTAEAGTYYYVTETDWVEENGERKMVTKQVRKIRWRFVSGAYSKYFDDIIVNASKKVDDNLMKNLEPFNLKELVQYMPQFLSGFLAERYSVTLKEGWEKAKDIIDSSIRQGIHSQINADEVRNLLVNTSYRNIKYKHILLPVWISSYTYKGKIYRYMINGQTGEVQGEAPVSALKVILLILAVLAVATAIYYFVNM